MAGGTWDLHAIGVNQPRGRGKSGDKIPALKGAEADALHWRRAMAREKLLAAAVVLTGAQAKWDAVSYLLEQASREIRQKDERRSLLWTFSGYGTRLSADYKVPGSDDKISHPALCLSDVPVAPALFREALLKCRCRYKRIVIVLDAAFCMPACHESNEMFQESYVSSPPAVYAPLRSLHAAYLADPPALDPVDSPPAQWSSSWGDLERDFENVSVVLADTHGHLAWETSTRNRDPSLRRWSGVFSAAAQEALSLGPRHYPWETLTTVRRLIPRRYFPQHLPSFNA